MFRYTCYVVKADTTPSFKKLSLSPAHFLDKRLADTITVVDRLGSLSSSFTPLIEHAKRGFAGYLGFAPYAMQKYFILDHTSIPVLAPSLALISKNPTFSDLLRVAKEFQTVHQSVSQEETILGEALLEVIELLLNINAITLVSSKGSISSQSIQQLKNTADKKGEAVKESPLKTISPKPKEDAGKNYEVQARRMRELGFDEDFIREALQEDQDEEEDDNFVAAEVMTTGERAVESGPEKVNTRGSIDVSNKENDVQMKLAKVLKALQETTMKQTSSSSDKSTLISSLEKIKNAAKAGGFAQPIETANFDINYLDVDSSNHESQLLEHYEAAKVVGFARKTSSNNQYFRSLDCWIK